jgi:hypothetical protein
MLDTNVLVSLLLFPNPQMNEMKMSYEYVYTPNEVDVFITGDKDFACIKVEKRNLSSALANRQFKRLENSVNQRRQNLKLSLACVGNLSKAWDKF